MVELEVAEEEEVMVTALASFVSYTYTYFHVPNLGGRKKREVEPAMQEISCSSPSGSCKGFFNDLTPSSNFRQREASERTNLR